MSVFSAKYSGRCARCPHRIEPGDDVVYVDDELVHLECEDTPPTRERTAVVCPKCWLEQPCEHTDEEQSP